ncbi:hypothetical protein K505DRAFT_339552 [Melanomma pulvis-pyrius CBS 109.77]|uniref:Uncharacterized protein n=1 Tax=Melanomma pulvis-pyrius CBS 109.77 TaxID=1314802 RepID=A0A6A6X5R7_9PLEO|nr:hypothetical protein K505DRAFT_339552 [Melanomma pulvis-pyrius CBS 109.77]
MCAVLRLARGSAAESVDGGWIRGIDTLAKQHRTSGASRSWEVTLHARFGEVEMAMARGCRRTLESMNDGCREDLAIYAFSSMHHGMLAQMALRSGVSPWGARSRGVWPLGGANDASPPPDLAMARGVQAERRAQQQLRLRVVRRCYRLGNKVVAARR